MIVWKSWYGWGIGIVIALVVASSIHFYDVGKRNVAIKSIEDSLVTVQKEKVIIGKQRDSIQHELVKQDTLSTITRIKYVQSNNQTSIKGDSAFDSAGKFIQILDRRISDRIKNADIHISSLESELKTAKYGFKIDTVFIAKGEQENGLNQSLAKTVKGSNFTKGLQAGVGYCRNSIGGTPCLYVGYGFSYRL